jgi:hypothetical protein
MIIQLKGYLDLDLIRIGLKPGNIIRNAKADTVGTTGAVYFDHSYTINNECVVWPENYDVIKSDKPVRKIQFTIT